jgi:hypothetical protein
MDGQGIWFKPDVPAGGVPDWLYDFSYGGGSPTVQGCNQENTYTATSWDPQNDTVQVFFGQDWERYTLSADDQSFTRGRFSYDSSPGVTMDGVWIHVREDIRCPYPIEKGADGEPPQYFFDE